MGKSRLLRQLFDADGDVRDVPNVRLSGAAGIASVITDHVSYDDGAAELTSGASRSPYINYLRPLSALTIAQQLRNIAYVMVAVALCAGAIALFWYAPNIPIFVLAFFVVSSRQQALLNVEHECSHGTFLVNRAWNHRIGMLAAALVGSPYWSARTHHLAHHRLVGGTEDPDGHLHKGDDKVKRGSLVGYFAKGVLGAYAIGVLITRRRKEATVASVPATQTRRDLFGIAVAQVFIGVVLMVTTAWWVFPLLWLAPLATLTAGCHLLRNFGEHALTADEFKNDPSRLITTRSNPLERFLVAPFNMNIHGEHHLFPWVPAPNLPAARAQLAALGGGNAIRERRSYTRTLIQYFRSLP